MTTNELNRTTSDAAITVVKETMQILGYNLIVLNGWIVKVFPDGSIEKIQEIESNPA